ncbi:MAG TPA: response regulator transcription factor [Bacteroidia bacterium]|jgi:DNA-binding NarL/FixJ family response regulator
MKKKIKLAIVDKQKLFRKGLLSLMNNNSEFEVVIEVAKGEELMEQLKVKKPDVLLLDIEMPETNGIRLAETLQNNYPEIKILVLSTSTEDAITLYLLERGVRGFLLKNIDLSVLSDAICKVVKDGYYFNSKVSKAMVRELIRNKKIVPVAKPVAFSSREIEIIKLICQEFTNKEIASRLFISTRTVDGHKNRIQRKVNAKNVIGIVMHAMKNHLLD